LKHAIGMYEYATEVLYATNSAKAEVMQQDAYEIMVGTLSQFCGIDELIICSRCLDDALASRKEDEKNKISKSVQ
jgi:hypothetical protein